MIEQVLPAIRAKWPEGTSRTIYIQQDNAKPHIDVADKDFIEAATKDGFDIRLCFQPPNNPDLNVLDLSFFRAIQTLQHQEAPKTVDELVFAVHNAFDKLPSKELNFIFLTLQSCMIEVMKAFGGFNYKISHLDKERMSREGTLLISLECDPNILSVAIEFLHE